MTRKGTVIQHTVSDSDTFGEMTDEIRVIWLLLMLEADDWGRLPDNINKLARRIAVTQKTTEQVKNAVEFFLKDGCLVRYTARIPDGLPDGLPDGVSPGDEISVLQWAKWEIYQKRLKSRDRAYFPNPKGLYEKSTNPLMGYGKQPDDTPSDIPDGLPDGVLNKKQRTRTINSKQEIKSKEFPPEVRAFAENWFQGQNKVDLEVQSDSLDKLTRIDGFPQREVFETLLWVKEGQDQNAEFWRGVIGSFVPLRETRKGRKCNKYLNCRASYEKTMNSPGAIRKQMEDCSEKFKVGGVMPL